MRAFFAVFLAVGLATAFVACSSSSSGGAPQDAGTSDASSSDVTTSSDAAADAGSSVAWKPCGPASAQCATVMVPLDYSDASQGTISLALVKLAAGDSSQRIGSLFVNFGGPGVPIVSQLAAATTPYPFLAGTANDLILKRFDIIGIDQRGSGKSKPSIICYSSAIDDALLAAPIFPTTDGGWDQFFASTDALKTGCHAGTPDQFVAHEDTASAARDIDAVRTMLGEDKISILAYSYGTFLGAMYATLFPSHLRAAALDSPILTPPDRRDRWRAQAPADDDVLDQFFAWCATSAKCTFGPTTGRTQASVAAAYDALVVQLDTTPITTSTHPFDGAALRLASIYPMYSPLTDWPSFGTWLTEAASGNAADLRPITDFLIAPTEGDAPSNVASSSYLAIFTADSRLPAAVADTDVQSFIEGEITTAAPRIGNVVALNELAPIVAWPYSAASPTTIAAPTAPPLLLSASMHDPACAYSNAAAMQTALGNGSYLLTYQGSGHVNSYSVACIGAAIGNYLSDPTTPPTATTCAAVVP